MLIATCERAEDCLRCYVSCLEEDVEERFSKSKARLEAMELTREDGALAVDGDSDTGTGPWPGPR